MKKKKNLKEVPQIIVQIGTGKDTDEEWEELIRRVKEKVLRNEEIQLQSPNDESLISQIAEKNLQLLSKIMNDDNFRSTFAHDYQLAIKGKYIIKKGYYWAHYLAYALGNNSRLSSHDKNQICDYVDCLLQEFGSSEKPITLLLCHTHHPILGELASSLLNSPDKEIFAIS